jgi:hypothetical protein
MHEMPMNIGAGLKVVTGLAPLDNAAGTRNGTGIDRATPGGALATSCIVFGSLGAKSGTPDSLTAIYKLEDSADNSTGWTLYGSAGTTLTADNGSVQVDIDLRAAKRYIRVAEVIAFVNGTSPKIEGQAVVVLGGYVNNPVS